MTLTLFQGHSSVIQFLLKILRSYLIKLKLFRIVKYIKQVTIFDLHINLREIIDVFPDLTKTL